MEKQMESGPLDLLLFYWFFKQDFSNYIFFSSTGMTEKFKKDLNTEERSPRLDYIIDRK